MRNKPLRFADPHRAAVSNALMIVIVAAAIQPLQLSAAEPSLPPDLRLSQPVPTETDPPGVPAPPGLHRIALLLPLTGTQRVAAEAVRDGFLAAHFSAVPSAGRPEIVLIDEERPGAAEAYQAALRSGADAVVGPLLKDSVTKVSAVAGTTRTLALNNLDPGSSTPALFYQFSLAPEDEALQIAQRAAAIGERRAIALLPDNELGHRLLSSFSAAVESLGGKIAGHDFYDPAGTNFTDIIQRLLLLDESHARYRALTANLGQTLEFEPTRRPDVDYIFLVASPSSGRLIQPQLRFLYAGDLPTYATSAIYQPGSSHENDLEGIMFVDAPIAVAPDAPGSELRVALAQRWPATALARIRLYAMGFDAYRLMNAWSQGGPVAISGLTGQLQSDPQNRVHRRLAWAQFRDGKPQSLGDSLADESRRPTR